MDQLTGSSALPSAEHRFESLQRRLPADAYNYDHFGPDQLRYELAQVIDGPWLRPGQPAPDFELPLTGGGTVRLSGLLDRPVLLHFTSFT